MILDISLVLGNIMWIKGFSIQKTKITSKFAYEITFYDFSYIKYKYKIFISNKIVLKKLYNTWINYIN